MGPRGEIGGKVQESRHDVSIEKHAREQQRGIRQDEEKTGDEEERQVLQVVQVNSPDALDGLVRFELLRIRRGVERRFLKVLRRAEAMTLERTLSNDGQKNTIAFSALSFLPFPSSGIQN